MNWNVKHYWKTYRHLNMIRAFNYHCGGLGRKELKCGYASNNNGHSNGQVRTGCGCNKGCMEVGEDPSGADFLFWSTTRSSTGSGMGWGAPKDCQSPSNHFHNRPEEQTAQAHSFAWRTRSLISGRGKFSCAKEPPQSAGGALPSGSMVTRAGDLSSPISSHFNFLFLPSLVFSFVIRK